MDLFLGERAVGTRRVRCPAAAGVSAREEDTKSVVRGEKRGIISIDYIHFTIHEVVRSGCREP